MGLILDSTVFIQAERQGKDVRQLLTNLARDLGQDEVIGISVITLMELAHGAYRSDKAERLRQRLLFLQELESAVPVYPVTESIAIWAARIDAETRKQGNTIALADLLIGATAVDLDYVVVTSNVRHFKMIPGLRFVTMLR